MVNVFWPGEHGAEGATERSPVPVQLYTPCCCLSRGKQRFSNQVPLRIVKPFRSESLSVVVGTAPDVRPGYLALIVGRISKGEERA